VGSGDDGNTKWQIISAKLVCDALHRAGSDAEGLGQLQDTHTFRKLLSHLSFGECDALARCACELVHTVGVA
jgi:hypothetical protein